MFIFDVLQLTESYLSEVSAPENDITASATKTEHRQLLETRILSHFILQVKQDFTELHYTVISRPAQE
jgi:hypothetical protein